MFKQEFFMGKRVLKSSLLDDESVTVFFTTRELPLKFGEKKNLKAQIEQNKKLICKGLKIPLENLIIPNQTHSDNVEVIEARSASASRLYDHTDALVTNLPNIALALNFADCVPIILYDKSKKVIAGIHAGWRGTVSKIVQKTVKKMQKEFQSCPKDIIALIGPAIGKCCFEVGEDTMEKILESLKYEEKSFVRDKMNVDLKLVNKFQLLAMGVEKIDLCEDCTCCRNELFFSYRKEKGNCARHSLVAMLKRGEK